MANQRDRISPSIPALRSVIAPRTQDEHYAYRGQLKSALSNSLLGTDAFTWGQRSGEGREEELRRQYLDALKHADATDDYGPLIAIATS